MWNVLQIFDGESFSLCLDLCIVRPVDNRASVSKDVLDNNTSWTTSCSLRSFSHESLIDGSRTLLQCGLDYTSKCTHACKHLL